MDYLLGKDFDDVVVKAGQFKTVLKCANTNMPKLDKPSIETYTLTPDFLFKLKLGLRYCAKNFSPYVYVDKNKMFAYTNEQIYTASHTLDPAVAFGITKEIDSTLYDDCSIGVYNDNIFVSYPDIGFGIFTSERLLNYPKDDIINFMTESTSKLEALCSVDLIKEEMEKISPVFFKETNHFMSMTTRGGNMTLSATSMVNGTADSQIPVLSGVDYALNVDMKLIRNIPDGFVIAVNPDIKKKKRLIAYNEKDFGGNTYIVTLGAE